jgi:hypothetical protein
MNQLVNESVGDFDVTAEIQHTYAYEVQHAQKEKENYLISTRVLVCE